MIYQPHPLQFKDWYIHSLQQVFEHGELWAKLIRCRLAVGFVFTEILMPENYLAFIESYRQESDSPPQNLE